MSDRIPGELRPADEPVRINEGRETATVTVENTGDRPAQVGSHFHFFEVNPGLAFDRESAYGMRLDIPAARPFDSSLGASATLPSSLSAATGSSTEWAGSSTATSTMKT